MATFGEKMASLQGTVSQDKLTPPAGPDTVAHEAITTEYDKLRALLGGMKGIDFEAKFGPMVQQVKDRPATKLPGRGTTFFAALGAPEFTQRSLMQKMEQVGREKEQKDRDLLSLQETITQGQIGEELNKGNFKKALAHSETLAKLQSTLDRVKRETALTDYKTRIQALFEEKKGLEGVRASNAKDLVQERAKAIAKQMGFDERLSLKLFDLAVQPALMQLRSLLSRNPLTGEMEISPEEIDAAMSQVGLSIMSAAQKIREEEGKRQGEPVDEEVDADTPAVEDPIRAAHQKLYGGKR